MRSTSEHTCMACATGWRDADSSATRGQSQLPEPDDRSIALLDQLLDCRLPPARVSLRGEAPELAGWLSELGFDVVEGSSESVDVLVATAPLNEWTDPAAEFAAMASQRSAKGVLVVWVALEGAAQEDTGGWVFRPMGLRRLLREAGFGEVDVRSEPHHALSIVRASGEPIGAVAESDRDGLVSRVPTVAALLGQWQRSEARERDRMQRIDRAEHVARSAVTSQFAARELRATESRRYQDLVDAISALRRSTPYRAMVRVGPWQQLDARLAWHQVADRARERSSVASVRRMPSDAVRVQWQPEAEQNADMASRPLTVAIDWLFSSPNGLGEQVRLAEAWTRALVRHPGGARIVLLVDEALDSVGVPEVGGAERIVTTPARLLETMRKHFASSAAPYDVWFSPLGSPALRLPGGASVAAVPFGLRGARLDSAADCVLVAFQSVAAQLEAADGRLGVLALAPPLGDTLPEPAPDQVALRMARWGVGDGSFLFCPVDLDEPLAWEPVLVALGRYFSRATASEQKLQWVFAGSGSRGAQECLDAIRTMGLEDCVRVIVDPDPEDRAVLIWRSRAVFGLSDSSLLTLMAANEIGRPVFCGTDLPNELGDGRQQFDLRNPVSIEAAIARAWAGDWVARPPRSAASEADVAAVLLDHFRGALEANRERRAPGLMGYRPGRAVAAFSVRCGEAGRLDLLVRNRSTEPIVVHWLYGTQQRSVELAAPGCVALECVVPAPGELHLLTFQPGGALGSVSVEGCVFRTARETADWLADLGSGVSPSETS